MCQHGLGHFNPHELSVSQNLRPPTTSTRWVNLTVDTAKKTRDFLLMKSDWTQMPDVVLTADKANAWKVYRQELRDVTKQVGFPSNITWPVTPA